MRMGKWAARRRQLRDEGVRARQRSGRGAAARRRERRQMMAGLHGLVAEAVQGVAGELAKAVEEAVEEVEVLQAVGLRACLQKSRRWRAT